MNQTEAEKFADERKKRLIKYFIEAPDPQDCTFAMALLGTAVCLAAGAWTIHNLYGLYATNLGARFLIRVGE